MDAAFEQQVRERAYHIWMAAGREDGYADLHWLSAEQAMIHDVKKVPAKKASAPKATAVKAVRKAAKKPAKEKDPAYA